MPHDPLVSPPRPLARPRHHQFARGRPRPVPCGRVRRGRSASPPSAPSPVGSPRAAGQAAVELVVLLPLVVAVLVLAWQVVLAAHAAWAAGVAARAAARAHAVGADAAAAARAHLPRSLERGLRVAARPDGGVTVSLRIPGVFPRVHLGWAIASARFDPQNG